MTSRERAALQRLVDEAKRAQVKRQRAEAQYAGEATIHPGVVLARVRERTAEERAERAERRLRDAEAERRSERVAAIAARAVARGYAADLYEALRVSVPHCEWCGRVDCEEHADLDSLLAEARRNGGSPDYTSGSKPID